MVIELVVINIIPPKETGVSVAKYVPMTIYQHKIFDTDKMMIEEVIDSKGKLHSKYSITKYDGEYYKLKIPYKQLRDNYFTPLEIKGLHK